MVDMNISDTLITFDTAKLAKEKGFIEHQGHFKMYRDEDGHLFDNIGPAYDILNHCSHAPTQSLLQRWLREKYNLFVWVEPDKFNGKNMCTYFVQSMDEAIVINKFSEPKFKNWIMANKDYEEALEKGLQEALKLLK
jgi:hypothetical protein